MSEADLIEQLAAQQDQSKLDKESPGQKKLADDLANNRDTKRTTFIKRTG